MALSFSLKPWAVFLGLALPCLGVCEAWADPAYHYNEKRIAEFSVGIFCKNGVGISNSADPETIKGSVERYDDTPPLVEETQSVPAIERLLFGVLAREKVDNGNVLITITHPPLGSSGQTVESWETSMSTSKKTMHAYYLGLSDGNPVGRWTITGTSNGTELFYAEFDVVRARRKTVDPCTFEAVS